MQRLIRHTAAALGLAATASAWAAPLNVEVYNPGGKSVFPVSSEIVLGPTEAVLIDAQFQRNDAQALVERLRASGRQLKAVYISHGDPDYYFGLDVIRDAFPGVRVVASASTVAEIKASMEGKKAYWGPILKDNAPQRLVLPEVLEGDRLKVDGETLEVVGLEGPDPAHTFVWIPSARTVAGGVVVFGQMHVWVADTQTPASRQLWQQTLSRIEALKPETVIPGHYLAPAPMTLDSVRFTSDYLRQFEQQMARTRTSGELSQAMKQQYPGLGAEPVLELSAKVIKGDIPWPQ
ncbi:MAG: MBL fold metallo-hydrolase [Curvibacter sp.]|nr:MBL fold metallo-hydrolase [Curvibacter sp.]